MGSRASSRMRSRPAAGPPAGLVRLVTAPGEGGGEWSRDCGRRPGWPHRAAAGTLPPFHRRLTPCGARDATASRTATGGRRHKEQTLHRQKRECERVCGTCAPGRGSSALRSATSSQLDALARHLPAAASQVLPPSPLRSLPLPAFPSAAAAPCRSTTRYTVNNNTTTKEEEEKKKKKNQ